MIKHKIALCLFAGALMAAATPARADHDAVQFGSNIEVAADSDIHDAVCFFCNVNVEGKVTGDIVVFFGSVHLNGDAQHDLVTFFGNVTAQDNSSVDDDLVNFFGNVRLGENVSIGKDLVSMFGTLHAASSVTVNGDRHVMPGWIFFGPLGAIILIVIFVVHEIRTQRRAQRLRGVPFPR